MPGRTIIVCGDSTATRYGFPDRSAAYPQLLRTGLAAEGLRVFSLARGTKTIASTRAELDDILGLKPDVVILAHGGKECLFAHEGALRVLACDPEEVLGWGSPARKLRQSCVSGRCWLPTNSRTTSPMSPGASPRTESTSW